MSSYHITPIKDTLKVYPVNAKFIFHKFVFTKYESLSQAENVKGIEGASWCISMNKKDYYWNIRFCARSRIPMKCEVFLELASETDSIFKHFRGVTDNKDCSVTLGTDKFMKHNELIDGFNLTLNVTATFSYLTLEDQRIYEPTKFIQSNEWSKRLQNYGQKDFKLIVGNESVQIHKFFLASQSLVIATMLENPNFKETQTGEMVITDFKFNTVKVVVAFCYGEDISEFIKFTENAIELLKFADKYDMESLKISFAEYYSKKLTKVIIIRVLSAAHKYNSAALKDTCINFIKSLPKHERTSIAYGGLVEELRKLFTY